MRQPSSLLRKSAKANITGGQKQSRIANERANKTVLSLKVYLNCLTRASSNLKSTKVHPHKFRRTLATKAIDKGMPIEQVQVLLGHSQIDTTLRYAMVNQNNVKASHHKYIG